MRDARLGAASNRFYYIQDPSKKTEARNIEAVSPQPRNPDQRPTSLRDHLAHQRVGQATADTNWSPDNFLPPHLSLTPDPGERRPHSPQRHRSLLRPSRAREWAIPSRLRRTRRYARPSE